MNVQRGDVVIVEFPFASGMESKRRPYVVIQNDRNNARLHNVIVSQMTTRLHPSNDANSFADRPANARRSIVWNFTKVNGLVRELSDHRKEADHAANRRTAAESRGSTQQVFESVAGSRLTNFGDFSTPTPHGPYSSIFR